MTNLFRYNSTPRFRLIGKINGLAEQARKTRSRLITRARQKKLTGLLTIRKLAISNDIRHHLLAYAFMRGTPYAALERKCREDNKPSAQKILEIVQGHQLWKSVDEKKITDWLAGAQ